MINVNSLEILYDILAKILFYGISNRYSNYSIEKKISTCFLIEELENSNDDFIYNINIKNIIEEMFPGRKNDDYDFNQMNALFLWMGEAYFRLFFKFHKSMEYVMTYVPIPDMKNLFHLYHEMSWEQLYDYFLSAVNKTPLLKKLLEKNNLSINKLGQLSGISVNTLNYYCQDDDHLFGAKFEYIFLLKNALDVNINVFSKTINNFVYYGTMMFDKHDLLYRNYLALFTCSYYSSDVANKHYLFNDKEQQFESNDSVFLVKWTKVSNDCWPIMDLNPSVEEVAKKESEQISVQQRNKTTLVIFEYDQISQSSKPYLKLLKYGFEKIFIINQSNIIYVNDIGNGRYDHWLSYITEKVNDLLMTRAKRITEKFSNK